MKDLITKVEVIEVSCRPAVDKTFTITAEMTDMADFVPSTAKKYVLIEQDRFEALIGEKLNVRVKPAKNSKKKAP